jgi:hypothetical protein
MFSLRCRPKKLKWSVAVGGWTFPQLAQKCAFRGTAAEHDQHWPAPSTALSRSKA